MSRLLRAVGRALCRLTPATLFLSVLASCGGGSSGVTADAPMLLRDTDQVMRPFVWFDSQFDGSSAEFETELDFGDPLRATTIVLIDWLARHDGQRTAAHVDRIIAKWRLNDPDGHLTYTFAYGQIPANWRSGMDSWLFPALLVGLAQELDRGDYRALARKLIDQASRDVDSGGTVWRDADGCWFSEYAWDGMTVNDEFGVLNGHLYALQAVKMLARSLQDPGLEALYQCGVRGTKASSGRYVVEDKWSRYMLNPPVIDQTHYVIFETIQYDALSALDDDPFFRQQAALRRALLQRHFPVIGRTADGQSRLTMSAVWAPHPYAIDTYALRLDCTDGTLSESFAMAKPNDTAKPVLERAMLNAATGLQLASTRCQVDADNVGHRFRLYEGPLKTLAGEAGPGTSKPFAVEALLDAYSDGAGSIVIDPSRRSSAAGEPENYLDTQGRLVVTPDAPIAMSVDRLFGFELDADGPLAIGVTVVSHGREFFRYYPATRAGARTLVLLSPLGFDGGEDMTSVDRITFFVYTDRQAAPVVVKPTDLLVFDNQAELYEYFARLQPNFFAD